VKISNCLLPSHLNVKTGKVHAKTTRRHTSADFIGFLADIVWRNPVGKEIHIVLDNLSAHKNRGGAG
jgi:transposase